MESSVLRSKAPPTPKDNNIVKIAVEMPGRQPQLIEFNQKQPLPNIIQELCSYWGISDSELYALRFNMEPNKAFVSERNRSDIKNGHVLQLGLSAAKITQNIIRLLAPQSTQEEKLQGARELTSYCNDPTFAAEFTDKKGIELIISYIEAMESMGKNAESITGYILPAFVDLMDHGLTQWEVVEAAFIRKVASFVMNHQSAHQDSRCLQAALSILESLVLNSTAKYAAVEKELTIPSLAMHLQNSSPAIQQNTMALINALFLKADDSKRLAIANTLNTRQIRNCVVMHILQGSVRLRCFLKWPHLCLF